MKAYRVAYVWGAIFTLVWFLPFMVSAQSSNQAQLHGAVTDSSGAVIPGATATMTDVGTNISTTSTTNEQGTYFFPALNPATYRLSISAPNFATVTNVLTLTVNQQTSLNITLVPASQVANVTVQAIPEMLDTSSATLGTDIPASVIAQLPLPSNDVFGLTFLAAGVSESAGNGIQDSYPAGTQFVSNGQRDNTADIRLDGVLITAPEQGEGDTSGTYYQALSQALQETKVSNSGLTAEDGSATIINEVMKSGSNQFHGEGFLYNQNSAFSARDFFNNGPKPSFSQYQGGFALGGPIRKNKTFFFGDFQYIHNSSPNNIVGTAPTAAELTGDFSGAMTPDVNSGLPVLDTIYNPFLINPTTLERPAFDYEGTPNKIDPQYIDPVGQKILGTLYPKPNLPGDPITGMNNFRSIVIGTFHSEQYDLKIDQTFSPKNTLSVRYGSIFGKSFTPNDPFENTGMQSTEQIFNTGITYTYVPTAHTVWISTLGLDRAYAPSSNTNYPSLTSVGFPTILEVSGLDRMPTIDMEDAPAFTGIFEQCCVDTRFAHTLINFGSAFSWTKGKHTLQFGGGQWLFWNVFWQPSNPTGDFEFGELETSDNPNNNVDVNGNIEGNDYASLLLGYMGGSLNGELGFLQSLPGVGDKSYQTYFYTQDQWRVTPKLTVNAGLRYQWFTPFTERHNLTQFSDFNGNSGVTLPGFGTLEGTTVFASSSFRRAPIQWTNISPRVGVEYLINPKLVIRVGAGMYTGYPLETNYQYAGNSFQINPTIYGSLNNDVTEYGTLENPFPAGLPAAPGAAAGKLANWGLGYGNNIDTSTVNDGRIYQWNVGVQRTLPSNFVVEVNYAANRSTHLPFLGTENRNFIPTSVREQYTSAALNGPAPAGATSALQSLVSGPGAVVNQPTSNYNPNNSSTIPLLNTLRPYPQFDGTFSGYRLTESSSWYNALQIVFHRRAGHYLTLEGNYTYSRWYDNASAGANNFMGTLGAAAPQELDHLELEWSRSANDAPQRAVIGAVVTLPIGRGNLIGSDMNRVLDGFIGGWQVSGLPSFQSGQPLTVRMAHGQLADGNQRPNFDSSCSLKTGISWTNAAETGNPYYNESCFSDPGDQLPGNAPRYFSSLRSPGIHQYDFSLQKEFAVKREGRNLEARADCFNCTNTPRFAPPNMRFEGGSFGTISSSLALPRSMQLAVTYSF
jgi:hypothetical protein